MQKILVIFVLLLVSFVSHFSFAESNNFSKPNFYHDEEFQFNIYYPNDWITRNTDFQLEWNSKNIKFEIYPETNLDVACLISATPRDHTNLSQEIIDSLLLEFNTKEFWLNGLSYFVNPVIINHGIKILDQDKVHPIYALYVVVDFTYPQNIDLRFRQHHTSIMRLTHQYAIICVSLLDEYDKFEEEFNFIANSFSLAND